MSHRFGAIPQNGHAVPDLDATIKRWTEVLGVGPWFDMGIPPFEDMRDRGTPPSGDLPVARDKFNLY